MSDLLDQLPTPEEIKEVSDYLFSEGASMLDDQFKNAENLLRYWRTILDVIVKE